MFPQVDHSGLDDLILTRHFVADRATTTVPDGYEILVTQEFQFLGSGDVVLQGDARLGVI